MSSLVYFSSASNNTHRFVEKLGLAAQRIPPLRPTEPFLHVTEPYVLVVPTYGGRERGRCGTAAGREVPQRRDQPQPAARRHRRGQHELRRGVLHRGGTSSRPSATSPYLYGFELMGTNEDVHRVREGLERFWQRQSLISA